MKRLKKGAAIIYMLFCILAFSMPAMAYTTIDLGHKSSLTMHYGKEGKEISNALFKLFRAADVSENGFLTLSGEFAEYPVKLNGLDSEGWRGAAETLAAYAQRDKRTPIKTGRTDAQGRLFFDDLDAGLYLAVGEETKIGTYIYTPEPMLILLPGVDHNDQWIYDLTVSPKYEEIHKPDENEGGGTIDRSVLKRWKGKVSNTYPEEVVVQLLQNGDVYDTVTLDHDNGWKHTWHDLDKKDTWTVTEYDVPEGYMVSVSREGSTFVITNTYDPELVPIDSREPKASMEPEEAPLFGIFDELIPGAGLTLTDADLLPQTGALWWPVPLMSGAGLLLFLIGWGINKKRDGQGEA